MARPKLGDGETVRFNMFIQDDLLKRIEQWRYENRIPSNSEALRILATMALDADGERQEAA